ncbi:ATP-dependent endonuclease [Devosia sp. Naph2]|uniref:ATP-dependent nuclease n=1 Tax=Devosia polycyclovorans TaxID=3345148 RepID=UPI0035D036B6
MLNIDRVLVRNYRCLREADLTLNPDLNIIVGDNECGKSTLLEAIHLALSGQLNGRAVQTELHPHIFNSSVVSEYVAAIRAKKAVLPPSIVIELYLADNPALAKLKGNNNSLGKDVPGIRLTIEFNVDYSDEYKAYVATPDEIRTLPIEYYVVRWRGFDDNDITARSIPVKPAFIDASTIKNNLAANRYVVDILRDSLTATQKVDMALSYRLMKDAFMDNAKVKKVNAALASKKGDISDKTLSVSLDTSSRSTWESGVMPHLDDIPMALVGKGEQNSVKIKLAMESKSDSNIVLIEEPENHLSFSNLNTLIAHIANHRGNRQLLITTHSSFVLNKLDLGAVVLFKRGQSFRLTDLDKDTRDYFMRLPGHDTLRLILAKRSILVEGPSDELIVQAAFFHKFGKLPLDAGVDVISVNSLAFKRFLDIAAGLEKTVDVVTDNDGDVAALRAKYADYLGYGCINIRYDADETYPTLEPQMLKANGKAVVEKVLGSNFPDEASLLKYMKANKADVALKFFTTEEPWVPPDYIADAIA